MRYFVNYSQNVETLADQLLEAGYRFITNGNEIIFRQVVEPEKLAQFDLITVEK